MDLGDTVADEISLPFDNISLEMIYRGLYYFHGASVRGQASNPIKYFADKERQRCLGIVKRQRKPRSSLIQFGTFAAFQIQHGDNRIG